MTGWLARIGGIGSLGCFCCLAACSGAAAEPEVPDTEEPSAPAEPKSASSGDGADSQPAEAEPAAEAEPENEGIPTECAKKQGDICLPSAKFVGRLCNGSYPNVALYMFQQSLPFTRGYLTRKTKAWNASGGASSSEDFLEFDEEVLILKHRGANTGGMQVSGAGGGYDALRWDGSCVTLAKEELTLKKPPRAKAAYIAWKWLDDPVRESLRESDAVDGAYKKRRKECKGVTMGAVTKKCEVADKALSSAIVAHVRGGGEVAKPTTEVE